MSRSIAKRERTREILSLALAGLALLFSGPEPARAQQQTAQAPIAPRTYSPTTSSTTRTQLSGSEIDWACLRWRGRQGVLRDPQILVRRIPYAESYAGTHHSFLYAPTTGTFGGNVAAGQTEQHPGFGVTVSAGPADGLAFWAGGFNFRPWGWWENRPATGVAFYSVAFVYDIPAPACDADFAWQGTPTVELPNEYKINGTSSWGSWFGMNHIAQHIDHEGDFEVPIGMGVFSYPQDREILSSFDYVHWFNPPNNVTLSNPVALPATAKTPFIEEADADGLTVLDKGQTAQLVFEFTLKVGAWCMMDCDPLDNTSYQSYGFSSTADLDAVDDLTDRALLKVMTMAQDAAQSQGTSAEPGVLYWMSQR